MPRYRKVTTGTDILFWQQLNIHKKSTNALYKHNFAQCMGLVMKPNVTCYEIEDH